MPFVFNDGLQHKRTERQIREIHEQEYLKYISNLSQKKIHLNISYEYIKEIERSRLRNLINKQNQYDAIQRENNLLSKRLFQINKQTIIDNKNLKYQQNFDLFNSKRFQQRLNEYKRINNENHILIKRINNVRGQLITKQQCDQDWQRCINIMKKNCDYPENIDRFVSNNQSQLK